MVYQYYDPHPRVCHMKQYECCKKYHTSCSLYHICKNMKGYTETSAVCKRDCATCDYTGCSMPLEQRKSDPLYINGVTYSEAIPLYIDLKRETEKTLHKTNHKKNYEFYNKLFGDYRERKNKQAYDRYHANPDFYRQRAREWARKHYVKQEYVIPEEIMPECRLDCTNCKYEDCILPEDWKRKAYQENFLHNNPNYFSEYRERNRELLREKGKSYYTKNKEKILAHQKQHRQNPKVKIQRALYDKQYRETHKEAEREKRKRYYERHKDEINAKKRQKRAEKKGNFSLAV